MVDKAVTVVGVVMEWWKLVEEHVVFGLHDVVVRWRGGEFRLILRT